MSVHQNYPFRGQKLRFECSVHENGLFRGQEPYFECLVHKIAGFVDRMLSRSPVKPGMTGQAGDDRSNRG